MQTAPDQEEESRPGSSVLVISRDGTEAGARRAFEDALLAALRSRGIQALVTPLLYYLHPRHPAVVALQGVAGELVIGSWMHPRAAFWTLRALGVGRPRVQCLDLGTFPSPEVGAEALLAAAGGRPATVPAMDAQADSVRPRWYPVVDGSLCQSCRKCLDFCLFGVYSLRDDKVVVSSPDNCKNGCPACARACPHGAIMFPHYGDPAIAGAQPAPAQAARSRSAAAREQDDLEHLVSMLEKLDE